MVPNATTTRVVETQESCCGTIAGVFVQTTSEREESNVAGKRDMRERRRKAERKQYGK